MREKSFDSSALFTRWEQVSIPSTNQSNETDLFMYAQLCAGKIRPDTPGVLDLSLVTKMIIREKPYSEVKWMSVYHMSNMALCNTNLFHSSKFYVIDIALAVVVQVPTNYDFS